MVRRVLFWILGGLVVLVAALGWWLWTPDLSRQTLEARYFGPESAYVEVEGVRLHVRDTGPRDAQAVMMLHGTGSSLHTWDGWMYGLSDRYRVVAIDLPAHGLTGADPTGDYSTDRMLALLDGLLAELEIDDVALIGNSLGGRIAWNYAASRPQRVNALVLVAPDGFASPGFEYGEPPEVPAMLELMRFALPKSMLRQNAEIAYADRSALSGATMERYHDLMRAPGVRPAMLDQMRQVMLVPPEPLLAQITAPTLLIWGDQDGMIPVSNADDYMRAVSDVRKVTFPDLGHVPHEEAPASSLVPVAAFLDSELSG